MADESILRLRIEADTTGLTSGLNKAEGELGQLATETRKVEQQLEETAAAADKAAGKFTQLGDASHMSFGKLSVAFTGATVAGNALLASLDGLTRALAAPVLELLDAEQAAAMLQGTFGGLTGEMQRVQDLASKLGANNAFFDDDALAQAGATLKLFGANADAIEQLLPYVNNLAIAFGVDVADAAQLVGQALQGQTRGLARFVPEVKGANSQLEVLAALQASAARNATIAEQRTAGLGGQLALLKRQAADAAQGFGTAMLPALNAVLGFINANMLPALGKLMGALAGLSAYFSNLGKGFSLADLTRIAGEAILNAEAQFNAVKAAVPAATGARITGIAGGLALPGSFGGGAAAGGGRAATGPRGVSQYGEPIGPAVPSAMRYEAVQEDEAVRAARLKGERELAEARQRQHDQDMAFLESAQQQRLRQYQQDVQARERAQQQLNAYYLDSAVQVGRSIASIIKSSLAGAKISQEDVAGVVADVGTVAAGVIGTALAGREVGEAAGKLGRIVSDSVALPLVKAVQFLFDPDIGGIRQQYADSLIASVNDQNKAAQMQIEAALVQEEAAKRQRDAAVANTVGSQARRKAALAGEGALAAFDIFQTIAPIGGEGKFDALIAQTIRGASGDQLKTFGDLAKRALGGDIEAQKELVKALTGGRETSGTIGNDAKLLEVLLQLAERFGRPAGEGADGQPEAATIQQGTSPDRPVYVFDVRPRDQFAFAPQSFFFRNRGAGTTRAIEAGAPLVAARTAPVAPRTARA
ncbi:MAG: hypothetical protein EBX40_00130 [Gammaproteobacteria bacterium]|nr:hypothetical protein [Gammaproteobacteria bacterium]